MKVQAKMAEKKFEPIELTITIESINELREIYHRHSFTSTKMEREGSERIVYFPQKWLENMDCQDVLYDTVVGLLKNAGEFRE